MAVFTRVKTWVSNEVLTASDLNGEFNNLLNNTIPASIEDYSADVSTMQTTTDPGGVGTESLATTLAGELTRIRYKLKQIIGGAQWYSTPDFDLTGTLGTSNIADGAITPAKKASLGQQVSSSCSTFNTTSTSYVDVTNLSVTITSTGRPIFVGLISDGTGGLGGLQINSNATAGSFASYKIVRDSTDVAFHFVSFSAATGSSFVNIQPVSSLYHIDVVTAGTYVYKLQMKVDSASDNGLTQFAKLIAYEL